jgi:hypothetical protein
MGLAGASTEVADPSTEAPKSRLHQVEANIPACSTGTRKAPLARERPTTIAWRARLEVPSNILAAKPIILTIPRRLPKIHTPSPPNPGQGPRTANPANGSLTHLLLRDREALVQRPTPATAAEARWVHVWVLIGPHNLTIFNSGIPLDRPLRGMVVYIPPSFMRKKRSPLGSRRSLCRPRSHLRATCQPLLLTLALKWARIGSRSVPQTSAKSRNSWSQSRPLPGASLGLVV